MKGLVYKIECAGRCYVGSTAHLPQRRVQHLHLLRHGRHHSRFLQRAFDKHGAVAFVVLESGIPIAGLIEAEARWIAELRPAFNGDQPGPTRRGAKQGDACRAKVSAANKGRRHSDTARRAISASLVGNRRSAGRANARKVTPAVRAEIARLRAEGLGYYRIGKRLGLSKKTVSNNAEKANG